MVSSLIINIKVFTHFFGYTFKQHSLVIIYVDDSYIHLKFLWDSKNWWLKFIYITKKRKFFLMHLPKFFSDLFLSLTRYQLEDESAHLDEMPLMMSEEGFENDESDYHTLPRARVMRRRRGLGWFICGGWKFLCTRCVAPGT